MKLTVTVFIACLWIGACGSAKSGTVKGLVAIKGSSELFAEVVLEDGTKVVAFPKVFSTTEDGGSKWELVRKGQKVEVEQHQEANSLAKWKIVRITAQPSPFWGRIGITHRDLPGGHSAHEVILEDGTKIEAELERPTFLMPGTVVEVADTGGKYWKILNVLPPANSSTPIPLPFGNP